MRVYLGLALWLCLAACSGGKAGGDDGSTSSSDDGGTMASCESFGHFGTPTTMFTLPAAKNGGYAYTDIQASFPSVDWTTLDRLYIPAGKYKYMTLGNLPKRDAARPLIITNLGGQVQVGPNDPGGNYIWSITGGSNWILTGRYDPDSKTGDASVPGHRCGAYANSRGKYGFLSDDAFATGMYLHMGVSVTNATSFELEYLEVTRSGFAGIRLLNSRAAGDAANTMANVRVHDNYIHDIASEGFYFGWTGAPPSNLLPGLQVYNNRIVRTGSEGLQVQDLGDGSHVHHNVVAYGGLHWLDNFGNYQDGCAQVLTREGTIELDHNVILGAAGALLSFFSSPEPGDGDRHVTFHDNYFADTRNLLGYLNGTATTPSTFAFNHNFFRGMDFAYQTVNPSSTDPGVVFGVNPGVMGAITFDGNTWDKNKLVSGIDMNGTKGTITATNNTVAPVAPVAFVASGYPNVATAKLSIWGATATLAPGKPPINYAVGDLVMYNAEMYRAKTASTNLVPRDHADAWEKLPLPTDDLRVDPSSPYAAYGVY